MKGNFTRELALSSFLFGLWIRGCDDFPMTETSPRKNAVVLSGGGARGAYQVGVLLGLSEILKKHSIPPDIRIISGVSAGAINAAFLASTADDFHAGVARLADLWRMLRSDQVFASDAAHMGKLAITWATELGFGSLTGTTPGKALLDTNPLRQLLTDNLNVEGIRNNLKDGHYDALVLTAVDYASSDSISFVQGKPGTPTWNKSRRQSEKAEIGVGHVMASSAIPLLFPPAQVGDRWFGDGCVRNASPCAPALYLGANRLLVIGVRRQKPANERGGPGEGAAPSVARVLNLLLNAVLLDAVEADVDRLERVNEFIRRTPMDIRASLAYKEAGVATISPSVDIGQIARDLAFRLPRIIRYLLRGLGNLEDANDIISYLLFDPEFCSKLIEIGREDALRNEKELVALFSE